MSNNTDELIDVTMGTVAAIAAISGIALIATYKYLQKYISSEQIQKDVRPKVIKSIEKNKDTEDKGFNLALISDLLTKNKVSIGNNAALDVLLKRVQQQSITTTIKLLGDSKSPEELIRLFDNIEPTQYFVRNVNDAPSPSIFINKQKINDLVVAEGLTSFTGDVNKQVELLINLAYAKGVETAKQFFTNKITELKNILSNNGDTSILFADIMDSIKFMC